MIKAVLFDLDGTLVDSLSDLANGVNRALEIKGYPTHPTESFKYFAGDGIPKMIERALPEDCRSLDTINDIKDITRAFETDIQKMIGKTVLICNI